MKVIINKCYGGFGLSEAAYEFLIANGVPVRAYIPQERDPETHLYIKQPLNDGEVIFDRHLEPEKGDSALLGRYWDSWTSSNRHHPLVIRAVEELGSEAASGQFAKLTVVEIPDGTNYEISEYDGMEHVAEQHATWG